jgi:hypothetical protein
MLHLAARSLGLHPGESGLRRKVASEPSEYGGREHKARGQCDESDIHETDIHDGSTVAGCPDGRECAAPSGHQVNARGLNLLPRFGSSKGGSSVQTM